MSIKKFSGHVPDAILSNNKPLESLLSVLDGMLRLREDEVDNYTRRFLYPLINDLHLHRRYVDEWKAEYLEESPVKCLDCLYRNYKIIYGKKGTEEGLVQLLKCLFNLHMEPNVVINEFIHGKPLILSDDDKGNRDYLPEGKDLKEELMDNPPKWVPTLLDDTWQHTYMHITITIECGYVPTADFINFIKSVIVLYLPMVKKLININLNFI